ncbi:hypothetical protein BU23DRAFT_23056 [Bimuria novae-zelandiae CBS 107.79]|uniref:Uncharacterized protein n=1 Tax=Bimuria novae-zelandiae CBS 107.79 TaxID=1447943 RepID=A0A6A5UK03_9PLEO|nr:hypothetical protein BU23DRAFT_23056 [Bimuria novae-zelandiae CBS 107.79]
MIPALGWFELRNSTWDHNSTIAFAGGAEQLWPTTFNGTLTGNETEDAVCSKNPSHSYCPAYGLTDIRDWVTSFILTDARDGLIFKERYSNAKREVVYTITSS